MKKSLCVLMALLVCLLSLCTAAQATSLDASSPASGQEAGQETTPQETQQPEAAGEGEASQPETAGEGEAQTQMDQQDAAAASGTTEPAVRWAYGISLTALQSPYLTLVNEENLLDKAYEPEPLVKMTMVKRATSATIYLQEACANALIEMFNAALEVKSYTYMRLNSKGNPVEQTDNYPGGMVLYLKSGYRSYGTQATTYANYLARNNNVDDGYVAKPGASEHQSGLCCDILDADYASRDRMTQDFKNTAIAQWMKENCAQFGFILRYTEDQEAVTGIKFEPWHFRYVGKEVAGYLSSTGITLEEFTAEWQKYVEDYQARGGNIEEQLAYEDSRLNAPPESFILDEYGADGDAEISLMF